MQVITNPFGITVFGAAVSRIKPDIAVINASVGLLAPKPGPAIAAAGQAARSVQEYLRGAGIADFGASRIDLKPRTEFVSGKDKFLGWVATISFRIRLNDLDHVDKVVTELVEAGANTISGVAFQSTRLSEVRAATRRLAVEAARAKAMNYCLAAGVALGQVLHIEDVNPNRLRGREGYGGTTETDDENSDDGLDLSLIEVGAAVLVGYRIDAAANGPA